MTISTVRKPTKGRVSRAKTDAIANGLKLQERLIAPPLPLDVLRMCGPQHQFPDRQRRGLGWLRDLPDRRDATLFSPPPLVSKTTKRVTSEALHEKAVAPIQAAATAQAAAPTTIDNRQFCSPIEDQGNLGSCTAQACAGMVEYMERRAHGQHIDASRLFLYKMTRNLLGWSGDTGAFLRTTMKAIVLFGAAPESEWPYYISSFDDEPEPFLYAYAGNYKAVQYLRLDPSGATPAEVLANVKATLAAGYVSMFGFTVYSSLDWNADIPFPSNGDSISGGHAVLAVGYDDDRPCRGASKGALLIRNSWSTQWGDGGYGWLPYEYVLNGLADDFWTTYSLAWVESGQFG